MTTTNTTPTPAVAIIPAAVGVPVSAEGAYAKAQSKKTDAKDNKKTHKTGNV